MRRDFGRMGSKTWGDKRMKMEAGLRLGLQRIPRDGGMGGTKPARPADRPGPRILLEGWKTSLKPRRRRLRPKPKRWRPEVAFCSSEGE